MPLSRRRPSITTSRSRVTVAGLAFILLASLAPVQLVAAKAPPRGEVGLLPTIHYEDAQRHADDRIAFKAGDRVTVPFTPRKHDTWKIDGKAPRALPAGRQSGRAMRDAAIPAPSAAPTAEPTPLPEPTSDPAATDDAADPSAGAPPAESPAPAPSDAAPDPAVDQPVVDPSSVIQATGAAWDPSNGQPTADLAAPVTPGGLRREVFGFLPYWELSDSSTTLDWEKISTVAYFGVGADKAGNLIKTDSGGTTVGWSGWTSSRMTSVINAAHASGARVVLTVQSFGWTTAGLTRQKTLLGSATARSNLAAQVVKAVRDRGADGVNLDFEPLASGYAEEFTALVRKIRSSLNAAGPGYQLTFDTTGFIGNYPIEDATASGGADAIMVMGYDYRSASSQPVGSIAPIGGPKYDIRDTLAAYLARVSPSKLILGVPYYGRAWSTETDKLNSKNVSGTKYGASSTAVYTTARELAAEHGRKYDPVEGVSWTVYRKETCSSTYGCVTGWRQLYYDDATALKAKYDLVNSYNLRGVGIWALGYDGTRTELYQALEDKFITDTVPPTIKSSSQSLSRFSPNGGRRRGHHHRIDDGHRPDQVGLPHQRHERHHRGDASCAATPSRARRRRSPGTARTRTVRSSRTARTGSPCGPPTPRTIDRSAPSRSWSTTRRPRSARRSRVDSSRPTATASRTPCRSRGRPTRRSRAPCGSSTRTASPCANGRSPGRRRGTRTGPARTAPATWSSPASTPTASGAGTGPAT